MFLIILYNILIHLQCQRCRHKIAALFHLICQLPAAVDHYSETHL